MIGIEPFIFQVTIFLDSLTCHSVTLMVPPVGSIKKSSPSYLLLGHTDYYSAEVGLEHCITYM